MDCDKCHLKIREKQREREEQLSERAILRRIVKGDGISVIPKNLEHYKQRLYELEKKLRRNKSPPPSEP